jgi:hypothetical protein
VDPNGTMKKGFGGLSDVLDQIRSGEKHLKKVRRN